MRLSLHIPPIGAVLLAALLLTAGCKSKNPIEREYPQMVRYLQDQKEIDTVPSLDELIEEAMIWQFNLNQWDDFADGYTQLLQDNNLPTSAQELRNQFEKEYPGILKEQERLLEIAGTPPTTTQP